MFAAALLALALVASSEARSYIVGGKDVDKPGKYPWQASLQKLGKHNCGATIVSQEWLVTAAHCIDTTRPIDIYAVVVGAHDIRSKKEGDPRTLDVEKAIVHPDYVKGWVEDSGQFPNDIAMIKVKDKIEYNSFVQPIKMDTAGFEPGTICTMTGWGYLVLDNQESLSRADVLQEAETVLLSNADCGIRWGTDLIHPNHQCVKNDASACMGDSGGPLVCKATDGDWRLVGATSWGTPYCGAEKPQMYSRVAYFHDWIVDVSGVE